MRRSYVTFRNLILAGEEPPKEFRVFASGEIPTTGGVDLFDGQAARAVMAAYEREGVDIMLDLEHLSLDEESRAYDPDARGWCKLELRGDELWAVDVRWTPDGERRLREKTQRYISPAFQRRKDNGRIVRLLNIAICAMPATFNAEPLVAASKLTTTTRSNMDPKLIKEALDALIAGDKDKCTEILSSLIAAAAGGGETPAETPVGEETTTTEEPPPGEEDTAAVMAAATKLTRVTGKETMSAAVDEVEIWKESHLQLEKRTADLNKERDALESTERRKLVGDLVKLGVEIPATAWSDEKGTVPCDRLRKEPIAELRSRVEKIAKARGGRIEDGVKTPKPPEGGGDHGLSERELKLCAEKKIKPEDYAAKKAGIRKRSGVAA